MLLLIILGACVLFIILTLVIMTIAFVIGCLTTEDKDDDNRVYSNTIVLLSIYATVMTILNLLN